ncbi:MAG: Rieske 2Fe-2S domain-containing protein [Planctomycetales bacterium]
MSSDSGDASKKKLSTAEILAQARAAAAAKKAAEAPAAEAPAAEPAAAAPAAETPAAPAAGAKPKSTAEILAAARAAAAAKAGGAAPAESKPAAAAPAAGGAKPKSTADILAAARAAAAAKAGGGAAAPAAGVAATPAAPKAAAPVGGPKPSVQEMLAAVRGEKGEAPATAVAKAPVVAPPMPTKPVPAPAAKKKGEVERRTVVQLLLTPFVLGWTAVTATAGTAGLAVARFMMPNVLTEPPSKFKVGSPGDFDLGTVSEKFKASNGIWIVHTDKYQGKNLIYALVSVCTHLGCTPSWLEGEQKFKCPCHGSGFYINGINFEGPAPRPLERAGIRLAEDGMLEVDKSLKFQEEMGQWADPNSFVEV